MKWLRGAALLLGGIFTLQGAAWLIAPELAAAELGMPLLDGIARSTQVGDFAMFFLASGVAILLGTRPGRGHLLYFPGILIGGAAFTRTLAWAIHGADFALKFIVIELATGAILLTIARDDSSHH